MIGAVLDGGCDSATVVLGASADDVRAVLDEAGWTDDPDVDLLYAEDWEQGMGASLRAGLTALSSRDAASALVTLVDLPDVDATVLRRVVGCRLRRRAHSCGRRTTDSPGHPVLIGREHWAGVLVDGPRRQWRAQLPGVARRGRLRVRRPGDRP